MKPFSTKNLTHEEYRQFRKCPTFPFVRFEDSLCMIQQITVMGAPKYILIWLSNYIALKSVIYHQDSGLVEYFISMITRAGEISLTVDKGIFVRKRLNELASQGLSYDSDQTNRIIRYMLLAESQAEAEWKHSRIGWVENKFCGYDKNYEGDLDFSCQGNVDTYIKELNQLIKDSTGCQLALAIGMSSVFIPLLQATENIGTPIYHFYGDSSTGKTTALMIAASIWGNPVMGKALLKSWNATDNYIMDSLRYNNGMIYCLDESSMKIRDFTNIIYCLNQGIDRARLNASCQSNKPRNWCTAILSSGEHSLLSSSKQNTGLKARVIEFFDLTITNSADHAGKIKSFCNNNYGILGRKIALLVEKMDKAQILKRYEEAKKQIREKIEVENRLTSRLISIYATILLTARIAQEELKITIHLSQLLNLLLEHHQSVAKDMLIYQSAYHCICEWVAKNRGRIQEPTDSRVTFSVVEAKFTKQNEVAILSGTFEKILRDNGFTDVKVVAKELKKKQLLRPETADGLQARVVINGVKSNCYRVVIEDIQHIGSGKSYSSKENSSSIIANIDFEF